MNSAADRPISPGASPRRLRCFPAALGLAGGAAIGLALGAGARFAGATEGPAGDDTPRARVAVVPHEAGARRALGPTTPRPTADSDAVARAKRMMTDCRARFDAVQDYTCTFYKRERFDGTLSTMHVMALKARTQPLSFYIKCVTPRSGREAIWIKGKNNGKVIAHDAGFVKVLAGTMYLDPRGGVAMEDNRHPISEAGLGNMIDTIRERWEVELKPGVTRVEFTPRMLVGDRLCTRIETTHPHHDGTFVFHRVRLFIDDQLGLPIRLEGYDWPKQPGVEPELLEEYTYAGLRINPGLTERDFDPGNPTYSYGRF